MHLEHSFSSGAKGKGFLALKRFSETKVTRMRRFEVRIKKKKRNENKMKIK